MEPIKAFHKQAVPMRGIPEKGIPDLYIVPINYSNGTHARISCWKVTWKDLFRILINRRVYLAVMGYTHPPVSVLTNAAEVGLVD